MNQNNQQGSLAHYGCAWLLFIAVIVFVCAAFVGVL
jgi:hypothetical protein